ncbi:unnamed protein product [Adineta steineri]|uniref:B box-type domain-containing protein n=1 Tax=Adineta steineri TaxID=433720 RepID=A0A813QJ36_9BILA|nr:unnamed protein product [Adineta steineri]CAF4022699.1 unnamed protein product [Adineta steineri]
MTTSKSCSICGTIAGTCICTGCQSLFCQRHFDDHRRQMTIELERLMHSYHQLGMRTQETIQTERVESALFHEIDQWQNTTMDKVYEVAEHAREQVLQIMRRKKTELIEEIKSIDKEIQIRQSVGDYVEYDLERLKNIINKLQQDLDQFIRRPIKLHINKTQQIDWKNLVYIEHISRNNSTKKSQTTLSGRSQSLARRDQSILPAKSNCLRVSGCDDCIYVPFSGGWNDGGYYRRHDGGYCHCNCHQKDENNKRTLQNRIRR